MSSDFARLKSSSATAPLTVYSNSSARSSASSERNEEMEEKKASRVLMMLGAVLFFLTFLVLLTWLLRAPCPSAATVTDATELKEAVAPSVEKEETLPTPQLPEESAMRRLLKAKEQPAHGLTTPILATQQRQQQQRQQQHQHEELSTRQAPAHVEEEEPYVARIAKRRDIGHISTPHELRSRLPGDSAVAQSSKVAKPTATAELYQKAAQRNLERASQSDTMLGRMLNGGKTASERTRHMEVDGTVAARTEYHRHQEWCESLRKSKLLHQRQTAADVTGREDLGSSMGTRGGVRDRVKAARQKLNAKAKAPIPLDDAVAANEVLSAILRCRDKAARGMTTAPPISAEQAAAIRAWAKVTNEPIVSDKAHLLITQVLDVMW